MGSDTKENNMLKTQLTIIPLVVFQMFTTVNDFHKQIPIPIKLNEDRGRTETRIALTILNAPKERIDKLTNGIYAASIATGIDPVLIASIIPKESSWKASAKSHLGYKGLMQTKVAHGNWDFAEADIMAGSLVLKDKLRITDGNLLKAMTYYKGHGGNASQAFARDQLAFYSKIKEQVNQEMNEREQNDRYERFEG